MEKLSRQLELASSYHLLSVGIERAAYYGLRAIIILFMVSETIDISREKAFSIYGIFASVLVLSRILGALLGDLLFGNKSVLIWGGLLQMLGAFVFCLDSKIAIYIGLGLVSLGSGLYGPNLFSQFGKLYKKRNKLLDVGFVAFYLAISAGSFVGVLGIGYLGEFNFKLGFIVAGILYFFATVILIKRPPPIKISSQKAMVYPKNTITLCITITFFISGIFWLSYEQGLSSSLYSIHEAIQTIENAFLKEIIKNFNSYAIIIFCLIALVYWKYNYLKRIIKIICGLVSAAIGFLIVLILTKNGASSNIPFLLFALTFIALSEVLIAPTINSLLVTYVKSKYLATIYSLIVIPSSIFRSLWGYMALFEYDDIDSILIFCIVLLIVMGVFLYLIRELFIETNNLSSEIEEIGTREQL